ncbi:MAG: hypothetical protein NTU44_15595 [Bacteroidetes bacterium]|nr:hypothetical protein [Bacteroidota bacterium]
MTLAIQKFHKTYISRELYNFEYAFEAYYYDKFYRFIEKVPFSALIEAISSGADSTSGLIYMNASLFNPKARRPETVNKIQVLSFYIRPEDYVSTAMKRVKLCPFVLYAGHTNTGGLRWGVPVSLTVPGFSTLPPVKKSQVYANAYKKVLNYYRSEYAIGGIKVSADLMECINPLQPAEFYDNSQNYQLFHL